MAEHRSSSTIVLVVGDAPRAIGARVTLESGEHGLRWHVAFDDAELGEGAEFEIIEGPGGTKGHLKTREERAALFGEVQLVKRSFSKKDGSFEIIGLMGHFSFAYQGPFRRLRTVFVGAADAGTVDALVEAWTADDHEKVAYLPWTLESLTRFVAARARELPEVDEVTTPSPGRLVLRRGETRDHLDLSNLFSNVRQAPENAVAHIDRFVEAVRAAPGSVENGDLMFRVMRATAPVKLLVSMDGARHEMTLASFAVADDLSGVFVRDTAHNMAYLRAGEVDGLAPDADALRALASGNILRSLPAIHIRGERSMFMVVAGGHYECSIALIPSFWDAMSPLLESGSALVAMPARDLCLIVDDEPELLAQLRERVDGLGDLAYPVTPTIYRVERGGRWFVPVSTPA